MLRNRLVLGLLLGLSVFLLPACESGDGGGATPTGVLPANSLAPNLWPGVPANIGITTGTYLYDEAINFAPGLTVFQQDPRLKDLFAPNGDSNLCWPTTMAMAMAYYKLWNQPPLSALPTVVDPLTGDFTQQVREFAKMCKTDSVNGTQLEDAVQCTRDYLQSGGAAHPWAYWLGVNAWEAPAGESLTNYKHAVTPSDIRSAIQAGSGVILEIRWYQFDTTLKKWYDHYGHYVWIAGYDYDSSWGNDHIFLKVVNPNINYSGTTPNYRWDTVTMMKIPQKSGDTYPSETEYFLDGYGFRGLTDRAFVRNILVFHPTAN